jgi:hypothetical protein
MSNQDQTPTAGSPGDLLDGSVRHIPRYDKKAIVAVEIEAWVTHKSECFVGHISDPVGKEWKAHVRHIKGVMEWEWFQTFEEAVAWCERYFLSNKQLTK